MNYIYLLIALITIYGDLLKRILPGDLSVVFQYSLALLILISIFVQRPQNRFSLSMSARMMSLLAAVLIVLYSVQLLTTFESSLIAALTHAVYMCVPLLYIVVIINWSPQFDLIRLSQYFLLLVIPINIVGLVQYFVDPSFLISTVYSGDLGGVIERSFLDSGIFSRYPSLFTSADRYSGIALMQLYFSFALLADRNYSSFRITWLSFNFISGLLALFIAGARSRILIALMELIIIALVLVISFMIGKGSSKLRGRIKVVMLIVPVLVVLSFTVVYQEQDSRFPVVGFLSQSLQEGDISSRVSDSIEYSLLPSEVTMLGKGLGTVGSRGKPGEFGVRSIWEESGMLWGSIMLATFIYMVIILINLTAKAAINGLVIGAVLYSLPAFMIIMSLLAGLTAAFEFSVGILISCSIAALLGLSSQYMYGIKRNILRTKKIR